MQYQKQLSPWVINRHLPNLQRQVVARFRRRNDAEGYLKVMQRVSPQAQFVITFEMNESEYEIIPQVAMGNG